MRCGRSRHTTAFATAIVALFAVTGCAANSDLPPPPASPAPSTEAQSPTLDLTPAEQQAVEEAQALFDDFMTAYIEDGKTGEPLDTPMGPVIGGRALEHLTGDLVRSIQAEFVDNRNRNLVYSGTVEWEFIGVDHIDLERKVRDQAIPAVWMNYCIDMTDWVTVDRHTGDQIGQPGSKSVVLIEAVWFDDDEGARTEGWRLADWEASSQPC